MVQILGGLVLAAGQWAATLVCGYLLSLRLVPNTSARLRLAATLIAAPWLLTALFYVLSAVGAFDRLGTTASLALLALLLIRDAGPHGRDAFVADLESIGSSLRELGSARGRTWLLLGFVGAALALLPRLLRAVVAPAGGWDALTYHLFRAGRWVQASGLTFEPTPDAGGYYAFYPPVGDILWSWVVLATHDHCLLVVGAAGGLASVLIGAYVAARELGAERSTASWAGLAMASTPAIGAYATSTYVDVMLLGVTLLGLAWLPRAFERAEAGSIVVCAAAFGLAAGIKTTGFVLVAAVVAVLAWAVAKRVPAGERGRALSWAVIALSVGFVGHAICAYHHGNPLYPFPVRVLGVELLAGNEENALLHSGGLFAPELIQFDLRVFLRDLFGVGRPLSAQHLNFGPAAVLVFLIAPAGVSLLREGAGRRATLLVVAIVVGVFVLKLGSNETLVLRTLSSQGIGRFLAIPFALLVLLGTRSPRKLAIPVFVSMTLGGAFFSAPRLWGEVDIEAMKRLLPLIVVGAFLVAAAVVTARKVAYRTVRLVMLISAVALSMVTAVAVLRLRTELKPEYYAAMLRGHSNDPHGLSAMAADAWPIWIWLDQQESQRIAFAAGWDGKGHNWYRSPLLGERLQHDVIYVSPIAGDELVDYRLRDEVIRRADMGAWVQRLLDAEVDLVVLGTPPAVEHRWVVSFPDVFEPVAFGERQRVVAFRFNRERALQRWAADAS